jgi:CheY-like chemotaxis protein
MLNATGKSDTDVNHETGQDESFINKRKEIDNYSIAALFALIAAVILLSFGLKLISGILIIAAAATGLAVYRKNSLLNNKIDESLNTFSSLNEKKDDVIIDFSHKIREPLNNLVIISELLMESSLQKKQKELLETFIASTNNMVTILNELTMKSAGNLSYQHRKAIKFNLLSTIQNTIELYNLKGSASIDFILNKKEFSDLECFGDPIILKQIFLDLFNTVETQISDRPTKVTITLKKEKDRGSESFMGLRIQTDKSIVLIDEFGNDNSLAARLIAASRGTFRQEIGHNSTVLNIMLPFVVPVQETKHKTGAQAGKDLTGKEVPRKEMKDLRILMVEDNLINQKITLLTLKPLVRLIDTAANGKEALEKFASNSYDLILMDITMPVMSGLIAAEKIRALESDSNTHTPIIAITANAMIGDKEKCLSAGMDDYISKPYQPAVLINKINNFL